MLRFDRGGCAIIPTCHRDHVKDTRGYYAIGVANHCECCNPFFTVDEKWAIEDAMPNDEEA